MALPRSERVQTEQAYPTQAANKPQLRIVESTNEELLKDPQREKFHHAVRIISQKARRQFILAFPPSTEPIPHRTIANRGISADVTAQGSEAWRLLRTHFEGYVTTIPSAKRGQEMHQLTNQGLTLRTVAEQAEEFSNRHSINLEIFGQRNNDGVLSEAVRPETLFELALHQSQDAQGLSKLLQCDASTFSRIFTAFEQAGLITVDRQSRNAQHPAKLTETGKMVVRELLTIAEQTGYPAERIAEIKAALQTNVAPTNVIQMTRRTQIYEVELPPGEPQIVDEQETVYETTLLPVKKQEERILIQQVQANTDLASLQTFVATSPNFSDRARTAIMEAIRYQHIKTPAGVLMYLYYDYMISAMMHRILVHDYHVQDPQERAIELVNTIIADKFESIIRQYKPGKQEFRYYLRACLPKLDIDVGRRETLAKKLFTSLPDSGNEVWESIEQNRGFDKDPIQIIIDREHQQKVIDAMNSAFEGTNPEMKFREMIILMYWRELGYEEIGQELGLKPEIVKTRLYRARHLLLDVLKQDGYFELQ